VGVVVCGSVTVGGWSGEIRGVGEIGTGIVGGGDWSGRGGGSDGKTGGIGGGGGITCKADSVGCRGLYRWRVGSRGWVLERTGI
jgi:hypothetical protein